MLVTEYNVDASASFPPANCGYGAVFDMRNKALKGILVSTPFVWGAIAVGEEGWRERVVATLDLCHLYESGSATSLVVSTLFHLLMLELEVAVQR